MWNAKTLSNDPIIINQSIKPLLKTWEQNPYTFLQYAPANVLLESDFPGRLYHTLRTLNQSQAVDPIRWRFYLLALYHSKQNLAKRVLRASSEDEFINMVVDSDLVDEPRENVKQNCTAWANAGRRYEMIATELGGKGILILLPEDIPRNT